MTALVIISLFYFILILASSKKGMEVFLKNKSWLHVSLKLLITTSFGLLVFGAYGKFEYNIVPDILMLESSSSRMMFFTMWAMLVTKSIKRENQIYMLSSLFGGLLFFISNFTTAILLVCMIISFLPKSLEKNKTAVRIMYLLMSILLVVHALEIPIFSTVDGFLLINLIFVFLLRFNFDHQEDAFSMYPSFVWSLIGCIPFMESLNRSRIFMDGLFIFSILGIMLLFYDFVTRKRAGVFGFLPAIILVIIPSFYQFNIISSVILLIPLFWYFLVVEDEDVLEFGTIAKINILLILFCFGLAPFTPGGWSLNMLLNELVPSSMSVFHLSLPFLVIAVIIYYGLYKAFKTVKQDPIAKETEMSEIIELFLSILITSFLYYSTLPDIFSETSSFKILTVLENRSIINTSTPWRTKNLIFMMSILFPLFVFGWVYWKQKKLSFLDEFIDKYKLKIQGFISGRLPFFEEGLAVRSHLLSVKARNRSELILRGMLFSPTVFAFEAIGTLGSFLGRMRPKGINSNLLYTIIVTAFILIFYLRKLL